MEYYVECAECQEDLSEEKYLIKYTGPKREDSGYDESEPVYFCSVECAVDWMYHAYNPYTFDDFKEYVSNLSQVIMVDGEETME